MFEILILFMRSSRQCNWDLHLASLHEFTKYFFAHDQLNYAWHSPMYLVNMVLLQSDDKQSWDYLKDNYSVSKSAILFTSIGSDHAMEQGNKKMKVRGEIIGITQNAAALHRFCLTAPLLNLISEEFFTKFQIRVAGVRNQHYQRTGFHVRCLQTNVERLVKSMENFNLDFLDSDKVYNIVSEAILRFDILEHVLEQEEIGKKLYTDFIEQ